MLSVQVGDIIQCHKHVTLIPVLIAMVLTAEKVLKVLVNKFQNKEFIVEYNIIIAIYIPAIIT